MDKLDYTYHNHTKRCGHASGEDEEFVLAAIEMGFRTLCFSDHIILPDRVQPRMRGSASVLRDYFDSIEYLKNKYKDIIEIHLGFEAEWFKEEYADYYRWLLKNRVEYLILGQHVWIGGEDDAFHWYAEPWYSNQTAGINGYADDLIAGMRSGLYTYVCHPDLYMRWCKEWNEETAKVAYRIAKAAKECDIPLEVNMGMSHEKPHIGERGYPYPCDQFWDIVSEIGCKAIIGLDSHKPSHILENDGAWFLEFVKKHKLDYIDHLEFKKIR